MFDLKIRSMILMGFAAIMLLQAGSSARADSEVTGQLEIRLRPATKVMHPNVRLTDIATYFVNGKMCMLSDLPRDLQVQLHQVQVVLLTHQRASATVTAAGLRAQLQRLRLIPGRCELIGADVLTVSIGEQSPPAPATNPFRFAGLMTHLAKSPSAQRLSQPAITDLSLERAIQDELARQFGMVPGDVQVRLFQKVINTTPNFKDVLNPVIQVTAPTEFPYGRHSLPIRILDGQRIVKMQAVTVDVRLRQSILMTKRPIATGTKIVESMLKEEIRFTDRQSDQLSPGDVVGMMAARSFRANEMVAWSSLREASTVAAVQSRPLVNAREAVQVIAKKKGMTVVIPSAEALQAGRQGQLIRVRNLRSNKVISARVVAAGTVELVL